VLWKLTVTDKAKRFYTICRPCEALNVTGLRG